jgi:hypothetical protein
MRMPRAVLSALEHKLPFIVIHRLKILKHPHP